jgi:hypothetical protein
MFDVGLFVAVELDTHFIAITPPDAALWRQIVDSVIQSKIVRHNLHRGNYDASAACGNILHKAVANELPGQGGNLAQPVPFGTPMFARVLGHLTLRVASGSTARAKNAPALSPGLSRPAGNRQSLSES